MTSCLASVASCVDLVAASYRKKKSRGARVVSRDRKSDGCRTKFGVRSPGEGGGLVRHPSPV